MKHISLRIIVFLLLIGPAIAVSYHFWHGYSLDQRGLSEIANRDGQSWLMQGTPNNRIMFCSVIYRIDIPLDEHQLKDRVTDSTQAHSVLQRNLVEVNGPPYWQSVATGWDTIYNALQPDETLASAISQAEQDVSGVSFTGGGLPLHRIPVSSVRKQLAYLWHPVISPAEGMSNKHVKNLFHEREKGPDLVTS